LAVLEGDGVRMGRLPVTVRILLENILRHAGGAEPQIVGEDDVRALARWQPGTSGAQEGEIAFMPARVLLQDFTGVPCVVDLAAMRDAVGALGGDPKRINPLVPAHLVIDHSVQVDLFGSANSFAGNVELEYERNGERYALLRWAQQAFDNFNVVPPGTGICHQVNLEYLGQVVMTEPDGDMTVAFPDTLVGTDSHTTMINGLGVLGWGVGGIEAEAVLLGQPLYQLTPIVVGMRLTGKMAEGVTATDLVLTVTQLLRKHGVVGKFVEFAGPGLSSLSLPDRATIANMSPEFGATATLFPVDAETLAYMRLTGRPAEQIDLVETYSKAQGLFRTDATPDPEFDEKLELDLATIEPSLAGPKRPQDRVALKGLKQGFRAAYADRVATFSDGAAAMANEGDPSMSAVATAPPSVSVALAGETTELTHGAVTIAAITSCTNTSNPSVMIGAGLVAKKATERGLHVKPYVKTSLAPGSRVVTDYLDAAGLTPFLEAQGFHLVGYGCTSCIGNSGPLPEPVSEAIKEGDLVVSAVLSGNRNFEGRVHGEVRANYLASPPLVVAFALAGTVDIDLTTEPLGHDPNGAAVYLRDIWPSQDEIVQTMRAVVLPEQFRHEYAHVFTGDERWQTLPVPAGDRFIWDSASTYVRKPPFFEGLAAEPGALSDITAARVLVMAGDSITTDHISPAGNFKAESPAGKYLTEKGVAARDFNSYGARRGNHEVMMRGTFGNTRLHNLLAEGKEGFWTRYLPNGEIMPIYDAAMQYQAEGTPLIILAGKDYGMGSSRDWAAKGTLLLGVRAAIAESFERIHRSNLVGMGVLPLQFQAGQTRESLGLTGHEQYTITGVAADLTPRKLIHVHATRDDGSAIDFDAIARLDSAIDIEYYRHGGILPFVLRRLARG
ncbi:MAG: aconitate hydratase AcnA, partial [Ktedonobacterales bacterium]|nr:aconitate hydratase AcnA [Ktedonobacterales bacterium]